MSSVSRRRFIGTAVAGALGVLGATAGRATARVRSYGSRSTKRATTADLVGAYFSDATTARLIGTTYLQLVPAEAAQTTLMAALAPPGQDPTQWWATIDGPGLQKAMRKRVHTDFATPDVIDLGGWQLARTECRLAALWSVTHP